MSRDDSSHYKSGPEGLLVAWDYVVLVAVLLISAAIGVYYRLTGGRQRTTQEYLLGDRNLSVTPVAFSLMASFMSAITLLGVSSENYIYGTQFVVINISYGLATPIAAYLYLPVFFKLQATSAYEYLEVRFGVCTRLCASLAFSLQMILYMGIVLYAPALAIKAVTGFSLEAAVLGVGLVCTFYSTIGGMKAVVVTDLFQSLLMYSAVLMVCIKGAVDVGGLSEMWAIANEGHRIEFDNISADPTERSTFWSLVIGGGFTYLTLYAVNQAQVQRLLSLKDLHTSQTALWVSWPVLSFLSITTSLSGLAIYSKYYNCDPIESGRISSADQLLPLYVADTLSSMPGLTGLFIAGIFSGSLSTVSSAVNSLAAVSLEDYLKPLYQWHYGEPLPEKRAPYYSKILALAYGLLCLGVAFLAQFLGGVLQASLTIFGTVGGPLFGLFTVGMFLPHANEVGAVSGLVSGLAVSLWIGFGGPRPPPKVLPTSVEGCNVTTSTEVFIGKMIDKQQGIDDSDFFYLYRISYLWLVVIGFVVTVIVGAIVSSLYNHFKSPVTEIDPDLFAPPVRKYVLKKKGLHHKELIDGSKKHIKLMNHEMNGLSHETSHSTNL